MIATPALPPFMGVSPYTRSPLTSAAQFGWFRPFTGEEIDSLRTLIDLGRIDQDQLVSNCSCGDRPIIQTRNVLKRYRKQLENRNVASAEIAALANQDFLEIVASARKKPPSRSKPGPPALSLNDTSVLTIPLKFRPHGMEGSQPEEPQRAPPESPPSIPIGIDLGTDEIPLGRLVIVPTNPPSVGRAIARREGKILVAFQPGQGRPGYVLESLLRPLPPPIATGKVNLDTIFRSLLEDSVHILGEVSKAWGQSGAPLPAQILQQVTHCAVFLQLLQFVANRQLPLERFQQLSMACEDSCPFRHMRGRRLWDQIREEIGQIVAGLG